MLVNTSMFSSSEDFMSFSTSEDSIETVSDV